jgi:hypothetical protein
VGGVISSALSSVYSNTDTSMVPAVSVFGKRTCYLSPSNESFVCLFACFFLDRKCLRSLMLPVRNAAASRNMINGCFWRDSKAISLNTVPHMWRKRRAFFVGKTNQSIFCPPEAQEAYRNLVSSNSVAELEQIMGQKTGLNTSAIR